MEKYTVYMHICPNNKIYIGITSQKPTMRWRSGNGYKSNEYFTRAIQKYGWDNFEHIILYENLSKEEAEQKEIELIKKYKTTYNKYGYNVESGGNLNKKISEVTRTKQREAHLGHITKEETKRKLSNSLKGRQFTEETKKKMSLSQTGKTHTKETKEKIRYLMLGRPSSRKGIKLSETTKNKISLTKRRNPYQYSVEERKKMSLLRSIPVICIETGTIYYGSKEAERQTKINHRHISECCKNIRKTSGGFHWKYYKEH